MVLKRPLQIFNGFWGDHHHWMFFGRSDHCHQWFYDGFWCCYHRFQWFSMVPDHWSNDAMVSMDRCGLKQGVLLDWLHALKLTIFERWSKVDQKERCVPQKLGAKSQMQWVCHVGEWQGKALQGRGGEGCWLRQPSTSPSNISRPVLHSQYLCSYFYEGYRHKISEGQKIV